MLLARVAEQLYWAARYVERAEMTARVVSEHTHLLVDLPTTVPLTWEPLLDVPGDRAAPPEAAGATPTEREVVAYLLADPENPSSVLASVVTARSNLRSAREVLSREAWEAVNNLYLYVTSHHSEGIDRWSRGRFLDRVIAEAQRFDGTLANTMSRDATYQFLRLGRSLERADMTGRVLDARAVPLLADPAPNAVHSDVQWAALLRSLMALQAYYQRGLAPMSGPAAVGLVLHDPDFPGSVGHCLSEIRTTLAELPRSEATLAAAGSAQRVLATMAWWAGRAGPAGHTAGLRDDLLQLRAEMAAIHHQIHVTFFPPGEETNGRSDLAGHPTPTPTRAD